MFFNILNVLILFCFVLEFCFAAQTITVNDFNIVSYLNDVYDYRKAINGSAMPNAAVLMSIRTGVSLYSSERTPNWFGFERLYSEIILMGDQENVTIQVIIIF